MKVLFAVSNEEISDAIVKKYQKEYKQIISYKNVYYFNAIIKELQKEKSYDRIVISEELEAFAHNEYEQIDKFIFDKLDGVSDEATTSNGTDIPIILICSDRRAKSDQILTKMFGIGIYNAIVGKDRSIEEVCRLIQKPRIKKESKQYYNIDSEDVNYQAENENDVSEVEIQNILAHYKRLGKNEEKFIDSFNNISEQYNDTQLRVISKFLPLNVRAVLEEKSPKYQKVMAFSTAQNIGTKNDYKQNQGPKVSEKLLNVKEEKQILNSPIIIPSSIQDRPKTKVLKTSIKTDVNNEKLHLNVNTDTLDKIIGNIEESKNIKPLQSNSNNIDIDPFEELEQTDEERKVRGRPKKTGQEPVKVEEKRRRGRPKKVVEPVIEEIVEEKVSTDDGILPGFEDFEDVDTSFQNKDDVIKQDNILPGFEDVENENNPTENEDVLPGFEDFYGEEKKENILPGFEDKEEDNSFEKQINSQYEYNNTQKMYEPKIIEDDDELRKVEKYEEIDLTQFLTYDKKVALFVGTTKNGTSFIVNNTAELLSSQGVDVAILDTTKNRNSYYIYTKNEEELRQTASKSIKNLSQGITNGVQVNRNLTIYTSLPDETEGIENVGRVLESLVKKHTVVLIDADFKTELGYFNEAQEIYLVQTYDILTIQPLTSFLRELKAKNILDERKLRVILNKAVKIKGINDKTIIGGMAFYNDPAMSFMTELFDRNVIKYAVMNFEYEIYTKYLEGVIECEVSLKGYSKQFLNSLKQIANMIYTVSAQSNNGKYTPPSINNVNSNGNFTSNMNNTLEQMKNRY